MLSKGVYKAHALSLPSRGAWIEIGGGSGFEAYHQSRSPRGERGLKSALKDIKNKSDLSLPSRGAWIEIEDYLEGLTEAEKVAPLAGSVD